MLAPGELALHISNTVAFIDTNPTEITLTPRIRQKSGTGTILVPGEPRPPQVVRLIDQSTSRNTWPGKIQTSDGVERLVDFILLAHPDAVVRLWDFWITPEGTFEVAEIYPSNQYEIRAAVVRRA
jgi:hypothetical protein